MNKRLEYYQNKIQARSDNLDKEYNGAFYGMSKRDAIEAITLALFEGFDVETEAPPNENPHPYQINTFLRKIGEVLEGNLKPYMYVSEHAFRAWHDRKQGIIKDYWDY